MRSMGKLSLTLIVVGTAACGSDNNNTVDAHVVVPIDSRPIDAPKVFNDAPPVNYDFTCFGAAAPSTATDPVTIAGTAGELGQAGLAPTNGISISFYKNGVTTALSTTMSAGGTVQTPLGLFTSANIITNGMPVDWYLTASLTANRTTYLYPPNLLTADLANVPVPLVANNLFVALEAGAQVTQDDTMNGMVLAIVSDCALKPIEGATLHVQQGGVEKGTQFDLGLLSAMAAGTFAVFNVPDGETEVSATYNAMTFPVKTVAVHKQANDGAGSITSTAIAPGPF